MFSFATCCSILILILCIWRYFGKGQKRRFRLPPGPRALPIMGNFHQIATNASAQLSQWAQQYGKLVTIYLGRRPAVVINDAVLMKKILGMSVATGKFESEIFNVAFGEGCGIFNTGGKVWQEQRTFFVNSMKTAGLCKPAVFEPLAFHEAEELCHFIKKEMRDHGKVYLSEILRTLTSNVLWTATTEESSPTNIAVLMEQSAQALAKVTNYGLPFFSWIKYIAPKLSGYTDYVRASNAVREVVRRSFNDPRRKEGLHQDLIYKYLEHVKSMKDTQSSFYGKEGLEHSFSSVFSLLVAGVETTASTMNFLICYLCAHPDVQEKVQREITKVVGVHGVPSLQDRKSMPYTEAVIEETLRMAAPAPLGVTHVLLEDVDFLEYKLPKGLCILPNISHMLYDPHVWGDPETFRPERFLGAAVAPDGKTRLKDFMVAFQPGKRMCPGEQLARDLLFLQVTKLLKTFRFSMAPGGTKEEYMDRVVSFLSMPKKVGIVAIER